MARVLSDDTYKIILENFKKALKLTKDTESLSTLDDIVKRLEKSPIWRKGQDYSG